MERARRAWNRRVDRVLLRQAVKRNEKAMAERDKARAEAFARTDPMRWA